ncbi:sulfotransferase 1B1-like [Physella acuta]|uniref:sulfotransferase 1B1-like n=1 Tax=Physella acuta TaxID=109671 RepID=UPI0027DBC30D|nr:sulfotransferase 1B1-like [Physella acuta]
MPLIKVADDSGHTMQLLECNGQFGSPQFNEEAMLNIRDFPLREDDVILCSYPKSGCHWLWEIVRILQTGQITSEDGVLAKESFMMEWRPYSCYQFLPSPRVLNNHMTFDMQPRQLLEKRPKVVFIYRNLKDVAVSFYYHHLGIDKYSYKGDFDSHIRRWVDGLTDNGSPFSYILGWEKGLSEHPELPVFVGSFEDFKENNFSEVKRLSEFLGHQYADDFLQQICCATEFAVMKKVHGEKSFKTPDGEPVMYRKGQVGDWKNHFTVALNEWFDDVIKTEMAASKLKFKYTVE